MVFTEEDNSLTTLPFRSYIKTLSGKLLASSNSKVNCPFDGFGYKLREFESCKNCSSKDVMLVNGTKLPPAGNATHKMKAAPFELTVGSTKPEANTVIALPPRPSDDKGAEKIPALVVVPFTITSKVYA